MLAFGIRERWLTALLNSGQQDMGDKGINAVEQKMGFDKDGKYDKYEEKGSDMARGQFEKATGKNVPDKFSN